MNKLPKFMNAGLQDVLQVSAVQFQRKASEFKGAVHLATCL